MSAARWALALGAVLLAAAPARARLRVVSPRADAPVLGDVLPLQVSGASTPPTCELDGAPQAPVWVALPRHGDWYAELPLAAPGSHRLQVVRGGRRLLVDFVSGQRDPLELGDAVAAAWLDREDPRDLRWQWGPGVELYALAELARVSSARPRYVQALLDYHRHHLDQGLPRIDYPDRCAPALSALVLARQLGEPAALPGADAVADYLRQEPRNALGALDHLGAASRVRLLAKASGLLRFLGIDLFTRHWVHSIWVDSLVMYGLTAVLAGRQQGDPSLTEFGLEQPAIFARVLQDPHSGLFGHAWDYAHQRPLGAPWLRGNGWVGLALVQMLEETPPGHPRRPELEAILRDLARGLSDTQDAAGLWPTLLDEPGGVQESSGSALAAFALARGAHRGVLPAAALERAKRTFRALTARLRARPTGYSVTGTSVATSAWPRWLYRLVPLRDDVAWGTGAYLLLAAELRGERW